MLQNSDFQAFWQVTVKKNTFYLLCSTYRYKDTYSSKKKKKDTKQEIT